MSLLNTLQLPFSKLSFCFSPNVYPNSLECSYSSILVLVTLHLHFFVRTTLYTFVDL